jgi:predicted AAA+ superfamily ATPase
VGATYIFMLGKLGSENKKWEEQNKNYFVVQSTIESGLRALKKEQKLYFWIWSASRDNAKKFENLVAGHFLKWIHSREDQFGEDWELRYFKDTSGREIDFILLKEGEPFLALE